LEYVREKSRTQTASGDAKRTFLEQIRHLVRYGEANHLFELPDTAVAVDAVRLLTVHASKGLEFRAVFLPILGGAYFPQKRLPDFCPPPPGLAPLMKDTDHEEEEECLFFVGLSRAKDVLCLSRANRYGKQNSAPSKFLPLIGASLPRAPKGAVTWPGTAQPMTLESAPVPVAEANLEFDMQELDVYRQCPQQFYYQTILGLGGGNQDTAFLRYHRCVRAALNWLEEAYASGSTPVSGDQLLAELERVWQQDGPVGHAFEPVFRRNAEAMLSQALEAQGSAPHAEHREPCVVRLAHGRVRFTPDHLETEADGTCVLRRKRTVRLKDGEKNKEIYGLYAQAARDRARGPYRVEVHSLATGNLVTLEWTDGMIHSALGLYDEAFLGILAQRFPPAANDRDCPRCPYFFACMTPPAS
jgi:DNA helicase II / ATP-dependent DNA helicase PcrA